MFKVRKSLYFLPRYNVANLSVNVTAQSCALGSLRCFAAPAARYLQRWWPQMHAPIAPMFLFLALAPAVVMLFLAYWRLRVVRTFSPFTVIAFSLGVALFGLVAAISVAYFLRGSIETQFFSSLIAASLCLYIGVFFMLGKRSKLPVLGLMVAGALALVPLYYVGFYSMLLTVCSFGECL